MSREECHGPTKKVQCRVQARGRRADAASAGTGQPGGTQELGVNANILSRWRRELTRPGKPFTGAGVPWDEVLATLRRELARVKKERDFLRDAAAFFAKESS
jgi:transposase